VAGDVIVTGSGDCTARAWSLDTARCVRTFAGHLGAINSMATDDTGCTLFTGSMDQTIRSFELATGRPIFIFQGHDGPVLYISVNHASRTSKIVRSNLGTGRVATLDRGRPTQPSHTHNRSTIFAKWR